MKKSAFTIILTLLVSSVFADGHNLAGLILYFLGYALVFFVAPLLILTILSVRYYFHPRKILFSIGLALLILICLVDSYFSIRFADEASHQRAGVAYLAGLAFFIAVIAANILLLYLGYRKSHSEIVIQESSEIVPKNSRYSTIELLVVLALGYWLVSNVTIFLMEKTIDNWYVSPAKYFLIGSNLIFSCVPVVFALVIRDKSLRIVAIIVSSLLTLFMLYRNIDWLIEELTKGEFLIFQPYHKTMVTYLFFC
jgi:hypothetical protein